MHAESAVPAAPRKIVSRAWTQLCVGCVALVSEGASAAQELRSLVDNLGPVTGGADWQDAVTNSALPMAWKTLAEHAGPWLAKHIADLLPSDTSSVLAVLAYAYRAVKRGAATLAVQGPPGAGKTALLLQLLVLWPTFARERPVRTWYGNPPPFHLP